MLDAEVRAGVLCKIGIDSRASSWSDQGNEDEAEPAAINMWVEQE